MGSLHDAKCLDCGCEFQYSELGGFNFAIINCDSCHRARSVSWSEKEETDAHGDCECGGEFRNNAKPRCEDCDSLNIEDLGIALTFD